MKRRTGRVSSRYGECTISSGMSMLALGPRLLDPLLLLLVGDDVTATRWFGASDFAYASASSTPRCTLPTSTTTVWFMRRGL